MCAGASGVKQRCVFYSFDVDRASGAGWCEPRMHTPSPWSSFFFELCWSYDIETDVCVYLTARHPLKTWRKTSASLNQVAQIDITRLFLCAPCAHARTHVARARDIFTIRRDQSSFKKKESRRSFREKVTNAPPKIRSEF